MHETERKERHEVFKQSNEAAITYSEKALYYAFYLNGGAVAALLTRSGNDCMQAAVSLGWGAFWAVLSIGITFIYQLFVAASWKGDPEQPTFICNFITQIHVKYKTLELARLIPIFFWCLSLIQFLRGISKLS